MPSYGASLCLIATVTINRLGIVSILQNDLARIDRLDDVADTAAGAAAGLATLSPRVMGLLSTVSALALQLANLDYASQIAALKTQVNDLQSRLAALTTGAPPVVRGQDNLTDTTQTATDAPGYNATVNQGVQFPPATLGIDVAIQPQNQYAGNVRVMAGVLMPAFTEVLATASPASAYNPFPLNAQQLYWYNYGALVASGSVRGLSVQRTRYDRRLLAGSTAQLVASGNPTQIFAIGSAGDLVYDPRLGALAVADAGTRPQRPGSGASSPRAATGGASSRPCHSPACR